MNEILWYFFPIALSFTFRLLSSLPLACSISRSSKRSRPLPRSIYRAFPSLDLELDASCPTSFLASGSLSHGTRSKHSKKFFEYVSLSHSFVDYYFGSLRNFSFETKKRKKIYLRLLREKLNMFGGGEEGGEQRTTQ